MRSVLVVLLIAACTGAPTAPTPPADPALPALGAPAPRPRVDDPQVLADFLPATLDGESPAADGPGLARTFSVSGRTVTVSLGRIDDIRATRGSFELLGKDVTARMNGRELRGLRVQGNPAQLARDLDPPNRGEAVIVAANTYLVSVAVEPAADLDEPLHFAGQLDIGGLTRLALKEARAAGAQSP